MTVILEIKHGNEDTRYYSSNPAEVPFEEFQKSRRTRRISANFRRRLKTMEKKIRPIVNEWMAFMIKDIQKGLSKMRKAKPAKMVDRLADWDALIEEGITIMKPAEMMALVEGGNSVFPKKVRKQAERFDPIGVEAIAWVNTHSAELVVEVTDATKKAIRVFIADGIKKGKSIPAIAKELRPIVGLTEKNIFAIANYEEWLIVNRPDATVAQIKRSTDVYARRLHRNRAAMIARTESSAGLNEGIRQGYGQQGIKNLERIESGVSPDEDCIVNNGRIYTIDEAQGVLPAHTNCCLTDTKIITKKGEKNIQDIKEGELVLTNDGYQKVIKTMNRNYSGRMIKINAGGKSLVATEDHPVFEVDLGWTEIKDLNMDSWVFVYGIDKRTFVPTEVVVNKNRCENINAIIETTEQCKVYNLETENSHTYYANGILVHNCQGVFVAAL